MNSRVFHFLLLGILFLSQPVLAEDEINLELLQGIPNAVLLEDDIIGGGKPSQEAIQEIKKQGFQSVIDLRTMMEGTVFEAELVKKMELKYFNIPVHGADISEEQVDQLKVILSDPENRPALLHCAAGGRVHALWGSYKEENR